MKRKCPYCKRIVPDIEYITEKQRFYRCPVAHKVFVRKGLPDLAKEDD